MVNRPRIDVNRLSYGKAKGASCWIFDSRPEVRIKIRRIFPNVRSVGDRILVSDTPYQAEDILWILSRYPHEIAGPQLAYLRAQAEVAAERRANADLAMSGELAQPPNLALPLREYQLQAVEVAYQTRGFLCGDEVGLGKTAVGIGLLAKGDTLPAAVVCPTHLINQWTEQLARFLPSVISTVIKSTNPEKERVPHHNVAIIPYSRIYGWRDRLRPKTVIFDEIHALRKPDSQKYGAAEQIAGGADWRLGLSATPVFNYGDEIHSVMNVLAPQQLGHRDEFTREWCTWNGRHHVVDDPVALGSFLRNTGIFIRRTRNDVARELPEVSHITVPIEYDAKVLQRMEAEAMNLAATILHGLFTEKGQAARQLDILLRQATGIAKAPSVADFVADIARTGERVVVGVWHREVYSVIGGFLDKAEIPWVMYSGSETPVQKQASKDKFVKGEASVMLISLRSGEGLDGLQGVCKTVVLAELDWSPQPIHQLIGRVHRDGQADRCAAYYLTIDNGSDPVVAGVLGLKKAQADGIVDLSSNILRPADDQSRATLLAHSIMTK